MDARNTNKDDLAEKETTIASLYKIGFSRIVIVSLDIKDKILYIPQTFELLDTFFNNNNHDDHNKALFANNNNNHNHGQGNHQISIQKQKSQTTPTMMTIGNNNNFITTEVAYVRVRDKSWGTTSYIKSNVPR